MGRGSEAAGEGPTCVSVDKPQGPSQQSPDNKGSEGDPHHCGGVQEKHLSWNIKRCIGFMLHDKKIREITERKIQVSFFYLDHYDPHLIYLQKEQTIRTKLKTCLLAFIQKHSIKLYVREYKT